VTPSTDIMFHVTTTASKKILQGLAGAAKRCGCRWTMFLTNDAVKLIQEPWFREATQSCRRIVVCEASWEKHNSSNQCPVEVGSQTTNSEMVSRARRLVSL